MSIGGTVTKRRGNLYLRGLLAVALPALVVLGLPWLITRVGSAQRLSSVADAPELPVALVLGAGVSPDGTPSPYLRARLDLAAELFTSGKVRAVLVSGDNGTRGYDEPTAMRDYLIAAGLPASKVVADFAGFDTYDSCVRATRIFGVQRAIVVSQSYHLPRAVTTCRMVGVDAVGVGDETGKRWPRVWRAGQIRELPANVKMLWDVLSRREPTLGARETSVDEALR